MKDNFINEAADEIELLRGLLREVVNGAWEMAEAGHPIDRETIGKVAAYLVSLNKESTPSALTPAESKEGA